MIPHVDVKPIARQQAPADIGVVALVVLQREIEGMKAKRDQHRASGYQPDPSEPNPPPGLQRFSTVVWSRFHPPAS